MREEWVEETAARSATPIGTGARARGRKKEVQVHNTFTVPSFEGARCAEATEEFFPEDGKRETAEPALALCRACDIRSACLEYALAHEEHGIWGGFTAPERKALRRTLKVVLTPVDYPEQWLRKRRKNEAGS